MPRPNIDRTLARIQTVQTLFLRRSQDIAHEIALLEFAASSAVDAQADQQYTKTLVMACASRQEDIDSLIQANLKEGWRKLDNVLRAILEAGITELLTQTEVESKIIINEYLDITHSFFEGKEASYVNKVLDNVAVKVRTET